MKFIITESEKKSIRNMYGLLNEQQGGGYTITGNYSASNCDELHAFQATGGKVIGNMNVLVKNRIQELNSQGINVKVTNVSINVNGMAVSWNVTISPSNDNWIGFTSRGAGCNNDIETRAGNDSIGNGPKSVIDAVLKQGIGEVEKIEVINDFIYKDPNGKNSFKQIFYRYKLKNSQTVIQNQQQPSNQIIITGDSITTLIKSVKEKTKGGISIDENNVQIDANNFKITIPLGNTKILGMSLMVDSVSKQTLNDKFKNEVVPFNPTSKMIEQGKNKYGVWWALIMFQ